MRGGKKFVYYGVLNSGLNVLFIVNKVVPLQSFRVKGTIFFCILNDKKNTKNHNNYEEILFVVRITDSCIVVN